MTRQKSFKRLVRNRMEKTGESYTAARAMLLAADEPKADDRPRLATSDEEIRRRTGRGWEEWFDELDQWGATERPHREIARWVAAQLDVRVARLGRPGDHRQLRAHPRPTRARRARRRLVYGDRVEDRRGARRAAR
jgi:hypothetical protein